MKNKSIALNVVLFVLIGVLFGMYFSLKRKISSGRQSDTSTPISNTNGLSGGRTITVACINDDTIAVKYTLMRTLSEEMQQRQQKLQDDYQTKGTKLQQEYADYQQKAQSGNISQLTAQKIQKDMEEKKAQLDDIQRQQEELVKEAQDKNQQVSQKVLDYVNKYNKSKHYDYIITYSSTHGPIIVTNPMFDITNEIVAGLNKESNNSLSKSHN